MEENNVMNEIEETENNELVETTDSKGSGLVTAGVLCAGALAIYGLFELGRKGVKLAKKGYGWAKQQLHKDPDTANVVEGDFEVVENAEESEVKEESK